MAPTSSPEPTGDDATAYYLEPVTLDDDDDDDEYAYEEVEVEDGEEDGELGAEAEDEDLEMALATLATKKEGVTATPTGELLPRAAVTRRPEVLDDFIRNVLLKMGMNETLDMFQREWYQLTGEGKLSEVDMGTVPDIYLRNQQLGDELRNMQDEINRQQEVASKAKSTWDQFRKERDFHKMHHKRVVQEKNKLIVDLKRLKNHYSNFEPMLQMMRAKYETAMKEKMLMKLERDRLASRVAALEAQLRQVEGQRPIEEDAEEAKPAAVKKPRGALLPPDARENPHIGTELPSSDASRWGLAKTQEAHDASVSAIAMHPTKPIVATASDDGLWKMWSLSGGDLIMSGDGHKGWLSGIEFSPAGRQLATCAEDGTVKIWDFDKSRCVQTLVEHTQVCIIARAARMHAHTGTYTNPTGHAAADASPIFRAPLASQAVWDIAYMTDHPEFLASCSMDHNAKLWDLTVGRCRQTFRGHVDSINSIAFQPYANVIATASGDKTLSLWDCRSGLCAQTFYGHKNACNSIAFKPTGETVVSTDADGIVRLWDTRKVAETCTISASQHPANAAVFDAAGKNVAVACDDAVVRVYDTAGTLLNTMSGHTDAVQCAVFGSSQQGQSCLVSGSTDCTFRTWH